MRKDGASYRQIAETVGVDPVTVYNKTSGVEFSTPVTGKDGKKYKAKQPKKQATQHGLFAVNDKQQDGYLSVLQKAKEDAPDIYEAVASGELKITEAQRELRHRQIKDAPALPSSKYRVIYAG